MSVAAAEKSKIFRKIRIFFYSNKGVKRIYI